LEFKFIILPNSI